MTTPEPEKEGHVAEAYEGWTILELMGHRRLAGYVREQAVGGASFIRIDVPSGCDSGLTAGHCGLHGDCSCRHDEVGRVEEDAGCPLHGEGSPHPQPWIATQLYSPSAVYCMTPCSSDVARAVARRNQPEPVQRWELLAPRVAEVEVVDPDDDDDNDWLEA